MRIIFRLAILASLISVGIALAQDRSRTEEDLLREKAIADFTERMKAANYPALFDKAAAEFDVPSDILKGVAFTLTRWEHLIWPPGETRSPENGMPRPFGIMSLWDNDQFFGDTLQRAAKLIGKDPQELKDDPYQNIRGGAALLKELYEKTAKPEGTTAADIESWRYALTEYVGIPERDLKHRFGLEVYEHMNKGYHQFGIEWPARTVNLGPMRAEVKAIMAEEDAKRMARLKAAGLLDDEPGATANPAVGGGGATNNIRAATTNAAAAEVSLQVVQSPTSATRPGIGLRLWLVMGLLMAAVVFFLIAQLRSQKK